MSEDGEARFKEPKTVPKVCLSQDNKSDLRPIALTSCLAKELEGFANKSLLGQVSNTINPRQFARHDTLQCTH